MAQLPQFVLLKSDVHKKYLCRSKQGASNGASLHFSHDVKAADLPESEKADPPVESDKVDHPQRSSETADLQYLKFEVERAKTVEGLVHIRSCYNNKYWARKSADSNLIVAEANEAEEDQSKWSCTLFKPVFCDAGDNADSKKMHLFHVGKHHVGTTALNGQFHLAVAAQPAESNSLASPSDVATVLTAVNAGAVGRLPEYVAFKGSNDKYLTSTGPVLWFSSSDIAEKGVAQRIRYSSPNDLQTMYIIDQGTGEYWTTNLQDSPLEYWSLHSNSPFVTVRPETMATLFSYSENKVDKYIAIKCLSANKYVRGDPRRLIDYNDGTMYLTADASTLTENARLRVAEPVLAREISDVVYDLKDSRIYGTGSIEKYHDSRGNDSTVEQIGAFEVEYKVSQTMSWNQSTTVNLGIKASWSAGIPYIGQLGVDISYEHSRNWAWGEQKTEEKTVRYKQEIKIPPGKIVTLSVVAQKAYCDVPFSCKVKDLMTWGESREYQLTHGLYTGCNEFEFHTDISTEDLKAKVLPNAQARY